MKRTIISLLAALAMFSIRAAEIPVVTEVMSDVVLSKDSISGRIRPTPHDFSCEIGSNGQKKVETLRAGEAFRMLWGSHVRLIRSGLEIQILSLKNSDQDEGGKRNLADFSLGDMARKWPAPDGFLIQRKTWEQGESNPVIVRYFVVPVAGLPTEEISALKARVEKTLKGNVTLNDQALIISSVSK